MEDLGIKDFWLSKKPYKHFYKFKIGKEWKIFTINNKKRLRKLLDKYKPDDVYYSKNEIYNTKNFENSKRKIVLKEYSCIDIDNKGINEVKKVLNIIKREPIYILNTSKCSYQILYDKLNNEEWDRLKEIDYDRTVVDNEKDKGRVIRLPYTYHYSGFLTKFITKEEIDNIKEEPIIINKEIKERKFYRKYISNKVKDKYVAFFRFNKYPNLDKIRKLQEIYKLGNLYFILYDDFIGCLSLKLMDKIRLNKTLKAFKQKVKYDRIFIPTSGKFYDKLITMNPKPLMVLEGEGKFEESLYHKYFLNELGFNIKGEVKKPIVMESKFE